MDYIVHTPVPEVKLEILKERVEDNIQINAETDEKGNLLISTFNMAILYFYVVLYCWTHMFLSIEKHP